METETRNLDVTTTSMDQMALNNMVVKMRAMVWKCVPTIINSLRKKTKRYQKHKGSDLRLQKSSRKVDRLQKQMSLIKNLDPDKISKYCLLCTKTTREVDKESEEVRLMTRVASHPTMKEFVERWRRDHPDWRDLAEFLQERVSRRTKQKNKTVWDVYVKGDSKGAETKPGVKREVNTDDQKQSVIQTNKTEKDVNTGSTKTPSKNKKHKDKERKSDKDVGKSSAQTDSVRNESGGGGDRVGSECGRSRGDAVVTEFSLEDLDSDEEVIDSAANADDVSFLFRKETKSKIKDTSSERQKDSFFLGGEESDASHDEDAEDKVDRVFMENISSSDMDHWRSLRKTRNRQKTKGQKREGKAGEKRGKRGKGEEGGRGQGRAKKQAKTSTKASTQTEQISQGHSDLPEVLHPSWAASRKRKMEATIQNFAGKKKTFDDD